MRPNNSLHNKVGFGLILVLVVSFIVMSFISASVLFTISRTQAAKIHYQKLQSMILAESGLSIGLWKIKNEPGFHTDSNYAGAPQHIKKWLINETEGITEALSSGNYKIIKEAHKKRLFSIGYLGISPADATARTILQLNYAIINGVLIKKQWQEL